MPITYKSLTIEDREALTRDHLRTLETQHYQVTLASRGLDAPLENPQIPILEKQIAATQAELDSLAKDK